MDIRTQHQVLHQPPPDTLASPPTMTIANEGLENVDHFPYLGSHLSSKADIDSEIQHRICCASGAFAKLRKRVFEEPDLLARTKLLVYKAVILPALLYGAETWTTYSRHLRALESYHQRHLRKILRASWEEKRTNSSILDDANILSNTTITKHQLQWTGHVIRMPDTRLPKQVLYSQDYSHKKRFKDNIRTNLKKLNINSLNWEDTARHRST